jgi:hypothetical protein
MRGECAYLATRTGCVAVIGRMPQFHADKLPVLLRRIPASSLGNRCSIQPRPGFAAGWTSTTYQAGPTPRNHPHWSCGGRGVHRFTFDGRYAYLSPELDGYLGNGEPFRSSHQDDFAKRPILDQMAQGFARLGEGIDPLDDRLDGSAEDQRESVPPRGGNRGG